MFDLYGGKKTDSDALARVKALVFDVFELPDDAVVMVTELRCAEDDCPDVETVIAVMGEPGKGRHHKLPTPAAEVTRFHLMCLAARGTHG